MRRWLRAVVVGLAALSTAGSAGAAAPRRVVSMNVCTDQLAMLIADRSQIISLSYLAAEPDTSVLADEARAFSANHGLAEEIFLLKPDLVLAGTFTTRTTVSLLRRLGFRVEEFAPENSFDDIRANIRRMGALLGHPDRAGELVRDLDDGLEALVRDSPEPRTVAFYYANNYTSGSGTLVDAVTRAAGLVNIGSELGLSGTVTLPLEALVMARPDLIVAGDRQGDPPALAQAGFAHPAFQAAARRAKPIAIPNKFWICGAPFTLEAARLLQKAARGAGASAP